MDIANHVTNVHSLDRTENSVHREFSTCFDRQQINIQDSFLMGGKLGTRETRWKKLIWPWNIKFWNKDSYLKKKNLHPQKTPCSPSMVMTLVFLNGKFLNMTVGNPIPWGCPEGCSIFFLKTKENLNFSLFGAQSRQNLFEVFYRLRQKKNFEKFCPEKKNIDKILKKYWENVDKIRCFYRSIAIWMNECK